MKIKVYRMLFKYGAIKTSPPNCVAAPSEKRLGRQLSCIRTVLHLYIHIIWMVESPLFSRGTILSYPRFFEDDGWPVSG
jgi:hypothetical protein